MSTAVFAIGLPGIFSMWYVSTYCVSEQEIYSALLNSLHLGTAFCVPWLCSQTGYSCSVPQNLWSIDCSFSYKHPSGSSCFSSGFLILESNCTKQLFCNMQSRNNEAFLHLQDFLSSSNLYSSHFSRAVINRAGETGWDSILFVLKGSNSRSGL